MTLPAHLLKSYASSGWTDEWDAKVREALQIPQDRYFSVTFHPPEKCGEVHIDQTRTRILRHQKISKSSQ